MSNPPLWGRDTKGGAPGPSSGGSHDATHQGDRRETQPESGTEYPPKPRRSLSRFRPQARTQHAITDAQQGLRSLLAPQRDEKHPRIISPSGATRSHRRGRVAGPSLPGSPESRDPNRESPTPKLDSAQERSDAGSALSIRGVHLPLPQHPD